MKSPSPRHCTAFRRLTILRPSPARSVVVVAAVAVVAEDSPSAAAAAAAAAVAAEDSLFAAETQTERRIQS